LRGRWRCGLLDFGHGTRRPLGSRNDWRNRDFCIISHLRAIEDVVMDSVLFYAGYILGKLSTMENLPENYEALETAIVNFANNNGIDVMFERKKKP
jgi:hypothetical protein